MVKKLEVVPYCSVAIGPVTLSLFSFWQISSLEFAVPVCIVPITVQATFTELL